MPKNSFSQHAPSGPEREARQATERSAALLLELIGRWKNHGGPEIEAKVGPNPEVSVKIGDGPPIRGLADSPAIEALPKNDIDYLNYATSLGEGNTHADLTRDVEIKIAGQKVFEVKDGEVLLNKIGPEIQQKISLDINPVPVANESSASPAPPQNVQEIGSPDTRIQVLEEPRYAIDPAFEARSRQVAENAGIPIKEPSFDTDLPASTVIGDGSVPDVIPFNQEPPVVEPPEISRQEQTIAAAIAIVDYYGGDGSGEKSYEGSNYRIHRYGGELSVFQTDSENNEVKVIDRDSVGEKVNSLEYSVPSELESGLIAAGVQIENYREVEEREPEDKGFDIEDDD